MIEKKDILNINFAKVPENYAKFLACGYDSIQESFNLTVKENYAEKLFELKNIAEQACNPVTIPNVFFGFDSLQMMPTGAIGFRYLLQNDDFQILIRDPSGKIKDWQVSVRYLSAGLWEYGYEKLKNRVLSLLEILCYEPNSCDWQRVTRCDFCFDFYSNELSKEMIPNILSGIVGTNKTKQQICGTTVFEDVEIGYQGWAKAGKIETLTIGNKGSLQVSLYDKTKEITEASGKTWFYEIWGQKYNHDVYRLEIRMAKEWLRNRNVNTMEDIENNLKELINEALIRRRLTIPSNDKNRSRWSLHPLWTLAYEIIGSSHEILKIGRQVTNKKEVIENMLIKQVAGCIRSIVVLKANKWDDNSYVVTMKDIVHQLFEDEFKNAKIKSAQERYKYIGEAA